MARKKPHEEHENHERWLVSYADFITLLFAFFVVMYAISSVNEGKFRVLSESLISAFKDPSKQLMPIQVGTPKSGGEGVLEFTSIRIPMPRKPKEQPQETRSARDAIAQSLKRISEEIERAMAPLIRLGVIDVRRSDLWIEVEIKANVLFESGSAKLTEEAIPILSSLAGIVKNTPYRVSIEGFTDNVPIFTDQFPSNWELSAHRSGSVVRLFETEGVNPERMVVVGYGEHRAKAANDTEEGRVQNRRVVMVITSDDEARRQIEAERAAELEAEMEAGRAEMQGEGGEPVEEVVELPPPPIPLMPRPVIQRGPGGEPIDVTSRPTTDVGVFPVIQAPVAAPRNASQGGTP